MTPEFEKYIDRMWDKGARQYFSNLRRLKLFANKIAYSLQIVGGEVNFGDFIGIELVRSIIRPYMKRFTRRPIIFSSVE
jgi:hypothetical protein